MKGKNKLLNNNIDLERYLKEREEQQKQKNIVFLLQLVRNNPNITEEMLRPDLRKYLGIVKREYKKEITVCKNKSL